MDLLDRAETETLRPEYLTSEHTERLALRLAENLAWHREIGTLSDRYREIGEAYRGETDQAKQAVLRGELDEAKSALDRCREEWRVFAKERSKPT
jgi:hypothetical protein